MRYILLMSTSTSNLSKIGNRDPVLLRKSAKKYTEILVTAGTKKFAIEGTNVSVISNWDGLSFVRWPNKSDSFVSMPEVDLILETLE